MQMLRADFNRLRKSAAFRLALLGMLALAALFMFTQATAMDYTVPLSRVIFLPLSMFGVAMSAFVSVFVGTDFSDGFIRNKLLAAKGRSGVVISQIIVCCAACLAVYCAVTAFSAGGGMLFFENNVDGAVFVRYFILGLSMSLATGCLFSVVAMLCGHRTRAVVVCMALAFGMLFLCLHTNEILVQAEYRDGALNPRYVGGIRREICGILHDLNPCGQAAQLSAWQVWHPLRAMLFDLFSTAGLSALGCLLFRTKDIK